MFMNVTLLAEPRVSLAVSEEAIESLGPRFFVYKVVSRNGETIAERTEVDTGTRQNGEVEIVAGLDRGDRVVTEGIIKVRDGGPVDIKSKAIIEPSARSGLNAGSAGAASAASPR